MTISNLFANNPDAPVALIPTLANFAMCVIAGFVLRSFYLNRSLALTGKQHIAGILPLLSTITFLVIVIVKSSLALSLGLVGALSIVRFRTPIKEPEELVYLFLAIAVGLGYAANQTLITTVILALVFLLIYFRFGTTGSRKSREYNLVLDWECNDTSASDVYDKVRNLATNSEVVKFASEDGVHSLVISIDVSELPKLDELTADLRRLDERMKINFFESVALW